jgi:hypothetical protein
MPPALTSREHLRIGGGYNAPATATSPAGGLDADNAGNLATNGDLTLGGNLTLNGHVSGTLTYNGNLQPGPTGCNKAWYKDLTPGNGLHPGTSGPITLYSPNAHQRIIAIPFSHTTAQNAALHFTLPPDFPGGLLTLTAYWTTPTPSLTGNAQWKLYGPTTAATDGNTLNKTVGVDTGLIWQVTDPYQGAYLLHIAAGTFSISGSGQRLFNGVILRAIDTSPFASDALLIGARLSYS